MDVLGLVQVKSRKIAGDGESSACPSLPGGYATSTYANLQISTTKSLKINSS
jgi:hypothetical protein